MTRDELLMLGAILDDFGTLTLATQGPDGPWAAALFFARDERLSLYFVSDISSRHARDLRHSDQVAATVNGDHWNWANIRGLQMTGRASRVQEESRSKAIDIYLGKFPELGGLVRNPASGDERKIARSFEKSEFFCIRPMTIRLIDNHSGFGHSTEFILDQSV